MGFRLMPLAWGRSFTTLACAGMVWAPILQQPLSAQQPIGVPAPAQNQRVQVQAAQSQPAYFEPVGIQPGGTKLAKNLALQNLATQGLPSSLDIALGAGGSLSGEVRDAQGKLEVNTDVVLWRGMQMLQRTRSDQRGQFRFAGLRGGQYRIATPDTTIACRAWTAQLAPPKARQSLLVVANMYSARGQQPINEVFCFNPFLMGTIIAAAIAIPIAVHDSGDGELSDGS